MSLPKLNILLRAVVPYALIFFFALPQYFCDQNYNNSEIQLLQSIPSLRWYKQAMVDLGYRISMTSPSDWVAISRGIGMEVKGKAYRFTNGEWSPFFEYEYSDYPLIAHSKPATVWTINHRVHEGTYKPIHSEFANGTRKEILLLRIMWDDVDYVMFKDIYQFPDGTAWMVGQQGHILSKSWINSV